MASIYANLWEQKKVFTKEKRSTPTGLVWDTNMVAVLMFWSINMAAVTSCEQHDRLVTWLQAKNSVFPKSIEDVSIDNEYEF